CRKAGYPHSGYKAVSNAKTMYWQMYGGHNCTNYAAYRLVQSGMPNKRPWTGEGNATHWGVAMAKITDTTPMVGSIAWWRKGTSGGASGHVAYVEQVVSPTEIIVSEDSWGGDFSWRRITSGKGWPDGFIHFNDVAVSHVAAPKVAATADSARTPGVQPGRFTTTQQPTITGTAEVDRTLTLDPGAVSAPTPATVPKPTIQWYADGAAIAGATGSQLALGQAQIGKRITARVTWGAA